MTFTFRLIFVGVLALGIVTGAVWPASVRQVVAATTSETSSQLQPKWQKSSPQATSYTQAELPFSTDHILVKLKDGERMQISVDSADVVDDALAAWSTNPYVEYAELDTLYRAYAQSSSWGYTDINAAAALSTNSATGAGAIVAVVDTGVDYNHEDLDANNWVNSDETAGDNDDDDSNGYRDDTFGYDFIGSMYTAVTPDDEPMDENGHGTHVSGIIGAENNTLGVVGVAPSATIMPVKVLDAYGFGWDSTIADGIRYAADNGADVINLSLGSNFSTHTVSDAIDYAVTNGVVVIAAAGNSGTMTGGSYPAGYGNVVSVGANNEDDKKAYFSNWGKVDVMAPGVDILSTYPGNLYEKLSGTSMASPHVAGVAALIVQDSVLVNNPRAVRHVLEVNASDWGTQTGADYLSGQGKVNAFAATGAQSAKGFVYANKGWIKSDGAESVTLTISMRNSSNAALSSQAVTWSTTKGTLSTTSSTTDANGEASITLTADDVEGLATITATSTALTTSPTMQIAIVPDNVQPETVGITPYITGSDTVEIAEGDATALGYNVYYPGDEVQVWTYATSYDRETHDDVSMTYSVTDPDGNAVTELGGSSENVSVGLDFYGWFYINQTRITSQPLTIPATAAQGEYTLTVVVTDEDTSETATRSTNFWVGEIPDVLVVYDSGYCSDTPVQGWDAGGMPMCTRTGHVLQSDLETLGYDVMLWDTTDLGYPTVTEMGEFPAVIWASAGLTGASSTDLQAYLDLGGNLLLSSEITAAYEAASGVPSDFLWNYLHARYQSELFTPDQVTGVTGGIFDGLTFDTNYYDLNGTGVHTSFYGDELEVNTTDDAEAILSYTEGSGDMTAGVRVATDTYRAVFLSFGIESINDLSGDATRSHVLDTLVSWLLGSGPSITSVSQETVRNNADRIITIKGHHFQPGGTTVVKLGSTELSSVTALSRTKIQATVPAGFAKGTYKLTVVNPDGSQDSKSKAITVKVGGPILQSVTPGYASNNIARSLTLTGLNFKAGTKVKLGGTKLNGVTWDGPTQLTVKIPKDFTTGTYDLKIINPNDKSDKLKDGVKVRTGFSSLRLNGDVASDITSLEKRLKNYGFFDEEADEVFDDESEAALFRYQLSLGLEQTGELDYLTRYNLNTNE